MGNNYWLILHNIVFLKEDLKQKVDLCMRTDIPALLPLLYLDANEALPYAFILTGATEKPASTTRSG